MSEPTSQEQPVLSERRERVLVITINRPKQRNAVNGAVAQGIATALDELDGDPALSVGIVTGAGGYFCAGMDLKAFVSGERPWVGDRGFAGITQRAAEKPLIAAIEGFAVAGGLEIALACDLIVEANGAKLGIPEVKRSLVAAGGGLLRLPHALPSLFVALRISSGLAVVGALIGENFAGSSSVGEDGLGYAAQYAANQTLIPYVFALVLFSSAMGLCFFGIVLLLEWYFLRTWHESAQDHPSH